MSLVALALRIVTRKALDGKTLAEGRVFDSEIEPLDTRALSEAKPIIVIYTDHDAGTVQGRDLLAIERGEDKNDGFDLTLHAAVASAVTHKAVVPVPEGEEGPPEEVEITEIKVPPTSEGLEVSLNLLNRQIVRVLLADTGPWAEMWRRLVFRISKSVTRRGADVKNSIRFAATERVLSCDVLAEPGFGADPQGIWTELLALLRTDDELKGVADIIEAEIRAPDGLVDWNRARSMLGLTVEGARGIGLAPAFETSTEAAPNVSAITVADQQVGPLVIDEPEPEPES